jgi:hypothetical protein
MASTITINEAAAMEEANRLFRMKQEAERQAARQRELAKQHERAELDAREREMRLQREAEEIEARRRAEEAIIAAKARAQKEAYDAAVAAHLAALEARSPEEKMMAELEALRNQLEHKLSFLDSGYQTLTQKHVRFEESCPWKSGLDEIKGLISGLDKKFTQEVTSLRALVMKPARVLRFRADHSKFTVGAPLQGGNTCGTVRSLMVCYTMSPQGGASMGNATKTIKENEFFTVDVPVGHDIRLCWAKWVQHAPTDTPRHAGHGNDVTEYVNIYFDA